MGLDDRGHTKPSDLATLTFIYQMDGRLSSKCRRDGALPRLSNPSASSASHGRWRCSTIRALEEYSEIRDWLCPHPKEEFLHHHCGALAPHVAILSNQTATIAIRTAGATSLCREAARPALLLRAKCISLRGLNRSPEGFSFGTNSALCPHTLSEFLDGMHCC